MKAAAQHRVISPYDTPSAPTGALETLKYDGFVRVPRFEAPCGGHCAKAAQRPRADKFAAWKYFASIYARARARAYYYKENNPIVIHFMNIMHYVFIFINTMDYIPLVVYT